MAIDPGVFAGIVEFEDRVERLVLEIRATRPAAGSEGVLLPGEPEWRHRQRNLREGIPMAVATVTALSDFAVEIGIVGLAT